MSNTLRVISVEKTLTFAIYMLHLIADCFRLQLVGRVSEPISESNYARRCRILMFSTPISLSLKSIINSTLIFERTSHESGIKTCLEPTRSMSKKRFCIMNCPHLTWLRFSDVKDVALVDTGRLIRLISELDDPSNQWPTFLLFVGRKAKQIALKEIYPYNNVRKGVNEGIVTLRSEKTSIHTKYPIFFAESDPFTPITPRSEFHAYCHDVSSTPLQWTKSISNDLFDIVYARLFGLFIDVLNIFADDFKDFDSVIRKLTTWASLGRTSFSQEGVHLKVIIVKRGVGLNSTSTFDSLTSEGMRYKLNQQSLIRFFSSITVLHLADQQISPLARHRRLKELIQRQTEEMRHLQLLNGCLYSALHLNYFFNDAVKHTAHTVQTPFGFVLSSRKENRVEFEYIRYLENFFRLHKNH